MRSYVIHDAYGNIIRAAKTDSDKSDINDPSSEFELLCDWPNDLQNYKVEDGQLVQKTAQDLSDEEEPRLWPNLRAERDRLLAASDWTQVPDAPVDRAAWAEYRQALRDLPANTTDPRNPDWPVQPV